LCQLQCFDDLLFAVINLAAEVGIQVLASIVRNRNLQAAARHNVTKNVNLHTVFMGCWRFFAEFCLAINHAYTSPTLCINRLLY